MQYRFTRRSRTGRSRIPQQIRHQVFCRDDNVCQFCKRAFEQDELTVDHLVPLSKGGIDEITNYVTCCRPCNERKANTPLDEFAKSINIRVDALPVHGDPVIDNTALPLQIRLLRKSIFDKSRAGNIKISGKQAQKKLEKSYRREFWQTTVGKQLEAEFPTLPGQVRVMIPEIQTIAKNQREFLILVELAKSANTRNLIGSILTADCNVEDRLTSIAATTKDEALKKRLGQALDRFAKHLRERNIQ